MSPRKAIAAYGPRKLRVRVIEETDIILVLWREHGLRRQESFPKTQRGKAEARAWAEGFAERRQMAVADVQRITVRALWTAYSEAEFPELRERSRILYRESWNRFELFAQRHFIADDLTVQMMGDLRRSLERAGLSPNTIRHTIDQVRRVYSWGERHELVNRNRAKLYRYKVAKDQRRESPGEYRKEEFDRILAQLDQNASGQWRAWVAISLCGYQGVRQRSVLNLRWSDVDFDAGIITWPAEFNKTGDDLEQPLRDQTRAALDVARAHHKRLGIKSEWVLPVVSSKSKRLTYSIQSLWKMLRNAEAAAGIEHQPYKAGHAFRRMVAGDIEEATKDPLLALQAIGDKDVKMMQAYLKKRQNRVRDAFAMLDESERSPPGKDAQQEPEAGISTIKEASTNEKDPEGSNPETFAT